MNWGLVKQISEYLIVNLEDSCLRIEPAGSFRRGRAECGDLELVCTPQPGAPRPEFGQKRICANLLDLELYKMERLGVLGKRVKDGEKYKQIAIDLNYFGIRPAEEFMLDLFIVRPETWGVQFAIRTGPADFSHRFVTRKSLGGMLPDDMAVKDGLLWRAGEIVPTPEEEDFFRAIGLEWIEPEDRK